MTTLTRRTFLTRTTASAATLGVAAGALAGGLGVEAAGLHASTVATSPSALSDPLMIYVTDASKGEFTFLLGTTEVTRRDPALVARLVQAVK
ncbi:MAG: hypothetical protein ACRDHP_05950 [Ktedonobacterales bacterium]